MKLSASILTLLLTLSAADSFARPRHSSSHRDRTIHHSDRHRGNSWRISYSRNYPYYYNGYYYRSPWWHSNYAYHGGYYPGYSSTAVGVTCSPETMVKNSTATEAVLTGLAQNELADKEIFRQKVADLAKMSGAEKIEEGFRLVGVQNPRDGKEIMNVIYARETNPQTIARVSENLNLSTDEAKLVFTVVTQALKQR